MAKMLPVLVLLMMLAACGSDGPDPMIFTDADSGNEISIRSGEEFTLRLESNPSTGYQWVIPTESMPLMLSVIERDFEGPTGDLIGAPGTQVFTVEADEEGAGVLRLEYTRPWDEQAIPEKVAEYVVRVDEAAWPPTGPDITIPGTTVVTAPTNGAMDVSRLPDVAVPSDVMVSGFVLIDADSARLCEVLMESYPPQCGGFSIPITNPDALNVVLEEAGGVQWTQDRFTLSAEYCGTCLTLDE